MQVLLGAATLFFCCCHVAGPRFQDLSLRTQTDTMVPLVVLFTWDCYSSPVASCCSSHLGVLLFSCCYDFFFLRTWLLGLGFQDSDRQTHATHPTVVSSFSNHFSLRPPSFFFSRHFSLRPVVIDRLRPVEAKRKAKNQRKERLFPKENLFIRPSVCPGWFCHRKC